MTKVTQEKSFTVFVDFQQTTKVFPTNFIKQNMSQAKPQKFSLCYDKIPITAKLFSHITFVVIVI